MASINRIKASDGTGNASVATVQTLRSAGASTIIVDTTQGIPTEFYASMGTPHTFVDPITAETITVISEETAVDFSGHIDGSNLEIDEIADGYTDGGSAVGDIIIIKPTTQWADNVAETMAVSHNDDGTIKNEIVSPTMLNADTRGGWLPLGVTPATVTNNGNRSYSMTFTGTDLTDTLSAGMRLLTQRTVAASTQCTDLEASSSQYASKSSPSGITFTDDFTCEAWVKLESYGTQAYIVARGTAGTNGFRLGVAADGRLLTEAHLSAGNSRGRISFQSLPLGKWTHVASTLDMSANTGTLYVDGVEIPNTAQSAGTATSLTNTGDLRVGNQSGGGMFDGKISDVRVWSTIRTATQIRDNMSQSLTGSETNLVAYFKLNGDFNDSTANLNHLTASGGATATDADAPFGGQASGSVSSTLDYGIIQKATFSTDTTVTVQVAEGCTIPTSGGVASVSYSTQRSPYGFPGDSGKWELLTIIKSRTSGAGTANTWQNQGHNLTVPTGSWVLGYSATGAITHGGTFYLAATMTLSTATTTESNALLTASSVHINTSLVEVQLGYMSKETAITQSSATTHYLNIAPNASSSTVYIGSNWGQGGMGFIKAINAYL